MSGFFIGRESVGQYVRYIAPSMFAFTISSIYGIVDGLFVGNVVGDAGLAAISVGWPIVQLALAVGTGIGMGGSVIASIHEGEGNHAESLRAMGTTLTMLVACAIPLMLLILFVGPWLMGPMGAQGETLVQARIYISAVAWGIPFYVIVMGALPIVRNRGAVRTAMLIAVVAGFVNVVLDYVFVIVLRWGTAGAAWATVIGQGFGFLWVLAYFLKRNNREVLRHLKPVLAIAGHALVLGVAPCGLSILPEITVVVTNINACAVGGEPAVAAYAVISYVAIIVQMMIQGVGDGSQPLISRFCGAGDYDAVKRIRRTNYAVTFALLACSASLLWCSSVIKFLRPLVPRMTRCALLRTRCPYLA